MYIILMKKYGKEIEEVLSKNKNWSKDKVNANILDYFKYNSEVKSLENAYYYYEIIYKENNIYKQDNNEKNVKIGAKVGVYDLDKNILYYYEIIY